MPNANAQNPTFTPDQVGAYVLRFSVNPNDGDPVEATANLQSNAAGDAISFDGNIADITGEIASPITPVDVSGEFSGTETPFSYAKTGNAWPSWANLDPGTGVISGTPNSFGTTFGHTVTGTDQNTDTAESNTFSFIIAKQPPTVEAGGPYTGNRLTPIQLDGSYFEGSYPEAQPGWTITSGGTGTFADPADPQTTFTPDDAGPYVIRLTIDTFDQNTVFDEADVNSEAVAPTVEAGGPYSGVVSTQIALNATVTPGTDPNPAISWTITSGGTGSFIPGPNVEDPAFVPNEISTYVLRCTVGPDDGAAVFDEANLTSTAAQAPIEFNGTIPDQEAPWQEPYSLDVSGYYSGTYTPFTWTLQAGTLPAGLTLNSSTGVISGTPTGVETQAGIVIRGTDSDAPPNTADSNAFTIEVTKVSQRYFYQLAEGSGDVMTNTGPTGAADNGSWDSPLNWTFIGNNNRYYPMDGQTILGDGTCVEVIGGNDGAIVNFDPGRLG